ncbi:hypothetical protein [Barnesiella viscericola]|uniref:hypothetical protein n=1 Tax=Barnesiella viscericola TaxID=397865 RepID=UPI0018DD838D|nr:hypothetical protein [Barnesiella viscericola]
MKKVYVIAALVFISIGAIAQVKTKHLEFEGVPINGSVDDFLYELPRENYEVWQERVTEITLKAIAGVYKDWFISVGFIPESKFVYKVDGWLLSNDDDKIDILSEYEDQKKRLIDTYGNPSYSEEKFSIDSVLVDSVVSNGSVQLKYETNKRYNYKTEFELPLGIVRLCLNSYLKVEYIDSANSALYDQVNAFRNLKVTQVSNESYKLFPTNNIWTFIKLDTRNGKMWQIQYDVSGNNRFEVELNTRNLIYGEDEENGRFTLYPTNNTYNFILLDQKRGMYGRFSGHTRKRRDLY